MLNPDFNDMLSAFTGESGEDERGREPSPPSPSPPRNPTTVHDTPLNPLGSPPPATSAAFSFSACEHIPRYPNPGQVQVTSPASSAVSSYATPGRDPLATR